MSNAALLSDRTAVVTGGSSGIGRAISLRFADHGADVVVADIRDEPREGGTPTHRRIREETDSKATFVECDVSERADIERAIDAAAEFGGVDAMVNNAGLLILRPFLETTDEEFQRMMDVNVRGTFLGSQVAAERMLRDENGMDGTKTIVNLSSIAGLRGVEGLSAYCASKGGVRLLTYALAAELGPAGIRVNAIHPGPTETMQAMQDSGAVGSETDQQRLERIPARRFGQPEDVAGTALYLSSELSEYVNGTSLLVDGGEYNTS